MADNWRCPNCDSLNPPRRSMCRSCGSLNTQFESESSGAKDNARDVQLPVKVTRSSNETIEANNALSLTNEEPSELSRYEMNPMYCPSCGKQIPADSAFCLHCGRSIDTVAFTQPVIEWETKDFTLTWKPGTTGWFSAQSYTEPGVRLAYWQANQSYFLSELQELLDKGWEPVSEIGPASVQLRYFKSRDKLEPDALKVLLLILWILSTFGVGLLFLPFMASSSWKYEMISFQVKLRRRKNHHYSDVDQMG